MPGLDPSDLHAVINTVVIFFSFSFLLFCSLQKKISRVFLFSFFFEANYSEARRPVLSVCTRMSRRCVQNRGGAAAWVWGGGWGVHGCL